MNFTIIKTHIYPLDVIVSWGQTNEELNADLDNCGLDVDNQMDMNGFLGLTTKLGNNDILIRFERASNTKIGNECVHEYIAHEVRHATEILLHTLGIKYRYGVSDEAFAYLQGYITKEIYKTFDIK